MFVLYVTYFLLNLVPILLTVAYFTLLERKIIAAVQRRKGPNVVGVWGLLQPVADGVKLLTQEQFFPKTALKFLFFLAPSLVFFLSLAYWPVLPSVYGPLLSIEYSLLFVQMLSSISVYGIFLAGISSRSKYAILGALRAVSQYVSYELCGSFCFLFVSLLARSANLDEIVFMQSFYGSFFIVGWPFCVCYFICVLAETNRTPFDISESEAEVVAGFHTEYSSVGFALFFLGEYCNILVHSTLLVVLFFGGWTSFVIQLVGPGCILFHKFSPFLLSFVFSVKVVLVCVIIIFLRAYLPRLRFDQSMELCWKFILPVVFGLFFIFSTAIFFNVIWKLLALIAYFIIVPEVSIWLGFSSFWNTKINE